MENQKPEPEQPRRRQSPVLPWKTRATIFFLTAVADAATRNDGTVNRRLLSFLASICGFIAPPNPNPRGGVKTSDATVDASRNLWFRIYVPCGSNIAADHLPVIVFFHGGGFVYFAPDYTFYDDVCRHFAREISAVVVSVNYRLAPEHRYPAAYDDGFDVLKFLDDHGSVLPGNADVSRCFLVGDSAGANLAHHVAKRAAESRFAQLKVLGVVVIQPFFGGEKRTNSEIELADVDPVLSLKRIDWMWKAFLPTNAKIDRDHETINVSGHNAADISKIDFPTIMVVVAGFDPLKDRQARYYEWLKSHGKEVYLVEYPNMVHWFYIFSELPESTHLIFEIKHFMFRCCSKLIE